jgi:hypothetical protein
MAYLIPYNRLINYLKNLPKFPIDRIPLIKKAVKEEQASDMERHVIEIEKEIANKIASISLKKHKNSK